MLSKYSVRRPLTVLVAVVIVLVLGFLSFRNMSTDLLPSMELPYALVMTTYAGASPEEVERAVSEPVEQAMARINNVKQLQSVSINNMSLVMMEFNDGTDMASTTVDMRESLDMVTAQWEDGIGSPTIMKLNPMPPARIKSGKLTLNGIDIIAADEEEMMKIRGKEVSMIFQDPMTSLNPTMQVGKQIVSQSYRKGVIHRGSLLSVSRLTVGFIFRQVSN